MICKIHKHSSLVSAMRCYQKMLERKVKNFYPKGVNMVSHTPPRLAKHGEILMFVFSEDSNMPY